MNTVREVICIQCPFACSIIVNLDESGKILSFEGAKCKNGNQYALREVLNPIRVLTTTVIIKNGEEHILLPVQTDGAIPKHLLKKAMKILADVRLEKPVNYNDVILENILGTNINVVATAEVLL